MSAEMENLLFVIYYDKYLFKCYLIYFYFLSLFLEDTAFLLYVKLDQIRGLDLNADLSNNGATTQFVPITNINFIIDIDYDSRDGFVYWLQRDYRKVGGTARILKT